MIHTWSVQLTIHENSILLIADDCDELDLRRMQLRKQTRWKQRKTPMWNHKQRNRKQKSMKKTEESDLDLDHEKTQIIENFIKNTDMYSVTLHQSKIVEGGEEWREIFASEKDQKTEG